MKSFFISLLAIISIAFACSSPTDPCVKKKTQLIFSDDSLSIYTFDFSKDPKMIQEEIKALQDSLVYGFQLNMPYEYKGEKGFIKVNPEIGLLFCGIIDKNFCSIITNSKSKILVEDEIGTIKSLKKQIIARFKEQERFYHVSLRFDSHANPQLHQQIIDTTIEAYIEFVTNDVCNLSSTEIDNIKNEHPLVLSFYLRTFEQDFPYLTPSYEVKDIKKILEEPSI